MLSVFLFIILFCVACWFITPISAAQVNSASLLTNSAIAAQPVVSCSPTLPTITLPVDKSLHSTLIATTAKLPKKQNTDSIFLNEH
jgi:hypothetical protein